MALMYPRTLVPDAVKSRAEVKVFGLLAEALDDSWSVFHSVSWVKRDKDGEIDFVLAHPDHGLVVLEVKGGGMDCRFGEWSRVVDGTRERMEDPFTQALDHRHELKRLLSRDDWFIAHCIALPEVSVAKLQLAPDAPRELVLDRHDVEDIGAALDRVLGYHRGPGEARVGPGAGGVKKITELLVPTVELRVPMAEAFADEEQALVRLTDDQALGLRQLQRVARVAVVGCAGSGKTMLAVEHARRLGDEGKDVLFVCFNKALAAHLHTTTPHDRVTYQHFHGLCVRVLRKAGVELVFPAPDAAPEDAQRFWRDEMPERFLEALGETDLRWDALIVDEAQDLHDHWLDALRLALRDEARAPIWLFLDDNQTVYDGRLQIPEDFLEFLLTINCRNTALIHRELLKLYAGEIKPDVRGPEGRPVELRHVADQAAAVGEVLDRLLGPDDVHPRDVVVLSSHGKANSAVHERLGARFVDDRAKAKKGKVLFSSIRAFKGLESPVVVLCELEDIEDETFNAQLYVGMSRAKNHCVLVAPPGA